MNEGKWEGAIKVRNGKLYFPGGSYSSFPNDIRIEFTNGRDQASLRRDRSGYSLEFNNRWDKSFPTLEDAVKFINKNKLNYDGIDDDD